MYDCRYNFWCIIIFAKNVPQFISQCKCYFLYKINYFQLIHAIQFQLRWNSLVLVQFVKFGYASSPVELPTCLDRIGPEEFLHEHEH